MDGFANRSQLGVVTLYVVVCVFVEVEINCLRNIKVGNET